MFDYLNAMVKEIILCLNDRIQDCCIHYLLSLLWLQPLVPVFKPYRYTLLTGDFDDLTGLMDLVNIKSVAMSDVKWKIQPPVN